MEAYWLNIQDSNASKRIATCFKSPLLFDHVIQAPQVSLTTKARGEHEGDKEN